ncbi:MAG TPA: hypothetical protein VF755_05975, partial [Catenuloplanes sp.]
MTTPRCVVYYGQELPDQAAARSLRDATVVLQTYHPLVRSARYAAWFPHCRRFVYWNPTGVPGDVLATLDRQLRLADWDPTWRLARVDPRDEATREYVVQQAVAALGTAADVHGLYVDDLDRWAIRRQSVARLVLAQVRAAAGREFHWVLNRGFGCWAAALPRLHAVTLEGLAPPDVDALGPSDAAWVRRVVLPPVRRARRAGVR